MCVCVSGTDTVSIINYSSISILCQKYIIDDSQKKAGHSVLQNGGVCLVIWFIFVRLFMYCFKRLFVRRFIIIIIGWLIDWYIYY